MVQLPLQHILFLDIETVSQHPAFESAPAEWQELWNTKCNSLLRHHEGHTSESLYPRASIYAEFGKIICISCGLLQQTGGQKKIIIKSFFGDDEKEVLTPFLEMLGKWCAGEPKFLCAHNGKEFDYPYLCRRILINGLQVPHILRIAGKKPWEVPHLDTLDLWRFGDYKNYTSLELLSAALGIPTPKDDIDGSMVGEVYWKEKNLQRIVEYCQKDVVTVAQVYLKLVGESLIDPLQIEIKA